MPPDVLAITATLEKLIADKVSEARMLRDKVNVLLKEARVYQRDVATLEATIRASRELLAELLKRQAG